MTRFLLPILIGATVGAALGYFGQCTSGTCPLTATGWRGAIFGALFGLVVAWPSSSVS
jgi:membrane associated rhomboid family serine protease